MAFTQRRLHCTPESVFAVLADGWLYPSWVVGASRMRDVEQAWPAPGSRLRHSVGVWPILLNDSTSVIEWSPPTRMILRARGWPLGEAQVEIQVESRGDECTVQMREHAVRGPATRIPRPLQNLAMRWRNTETLHRLAYLAEGRERGKHGTVDKEEQAESA